MPRFGSASGWRTACLTAACTLAVAGCSGTVEASYRPPGPPPPSVAPVLATSTPTPAPSPALACGPDKVTVEVGALQSDAASRAVPLLIRGTGPVPCGVANPVGIQLVDAAGQTLTTRVETADLPAGRTAVDNFTAEKGVMVWLQWRAAPSPRSTTPTTAPTPSPTATATAAATPTVDPATECSDGQSLRLTLVDAAAPIPVPAAVRACDGGTVYVSPAELNLG